MTPLRGVFLIRRTQLFPSFTWGRGNNSNLACLSPKRIPVPDMGSLSLKAAFSIFNPSGEWFARHK